MLNPHRFPPARITASVFVNIGLALAGGGAPPIILGGSWYYAITGIAIALTGVRRRSPALAGRRRRGKSVGIC
jgi:quinoprotein glucose dehydrogenase